MLISPSCTENMRTPIFSSISPLIGIFSKYRLSTSLGLGEERWKVKRHGSSLQEAQLQGCQTLSLGTREKQRVWRGPRRDGAAKSELNPGDGLRPEGQHVSRPEAGQEQSVRGHASISDVWGRQKDKKWSWTDRDGLGEPRVPYHRVWLYPIGSRQSPNLQNGYLQCKYSKHYGYLIWQSDLNIFPLGSMD